MNYFLVPIGVFGLVLAIATVQKGCTDASLADACATKCYKNHYCGAQTEVQDKDLSIVINKLCYCLESGGTTYKMYP